MLAKNSVRRGSKRGEKEFHNSIRSNTSFLKCRAKTLLFLLMIILGIWQASGPLKTTKAQPISAASNQAPAVTGQINALKPISMTMIDEAIAVLERGLQGMDVQERKLLFQIFDPAETGDIDERYVGTMLENYQAIRETLKEDFNVHEVDFSMCTGQRIYLTNLTDLLVCPYFQEEVNEYRKARTLVHEVSHMALVVTDRPYYRPTSKAYKTLTPRGSWATQIPIAGPIIRELLRGDTLYHPDAYAHFAMAVSGLPGSEKYHDHRPDSSLTALKETDVSNDLREQILASTIQIDAYDDIRSEGDVIHSHKEQGLGTLVEHNGQWLMNIV